MEVVGALEEGYPKGIFYEQTMDGFSGSGDAQY